MNHELYIYYRVRAREASAAQAAVLQMQSALRAAYPALVARWLRRPDEDQGLQTWMETYAIDAGITDAMRAHIEAQALVLRSFIDGPRHTEVFVASGASAGPPQADPHPLGGSANDPGRRGAPCA